MKAFLLSIFLGVAQLALCDTIDNWQIYLNDQVIAQFNQNTKFPEITTSFRFTDTLSIHYNECQGRTHTILVFCDLGRGDSVIAWNDGDYYFPDQSEIMLLATAFDSTYWQDAYSGNGTVRMAARDMYGISPNSREPLRFYYTNRSWVDKKFDSALLFSLKLIPPELHFTLKGTVRNMTVDRLSETDLYLVRGEDTLSCTTSDENGAYAFPDSLLKSKDIYKLRGFKKDHYFNEVTVDLRELKFDQDFVIDLVFLQKSNCFADLTAYFDPKSYRTIHNFNAAFLSEFFKENPDLCLEFSLTQLDNESLRLGRKRLEAFKKLLEASGVNPKQYTISEQQLTYQTSLPVRPAIQFKVLSFEGACRD